MESGKGWRHIDERKGREAFEEESERVMKRKTKLRRDFRRLMNEVDEAKRREVHLNEYLPVGFRCQVDPLTAVAASKGKQSRKRKSLSILIGTRFPLKLPLPFAPLNLVSSPTLSFVAGAIFCQYAS